MDYQITLNSDTEGMLRSDSREARKFLAPVLGPSAVTVVAVVAELAAKSTDGMVESAEDLSMRSGISEAKLAKVLDRLAHARNSLIQLTAVDEKTTAISVNQWVDPPGAGLRAEHYSAALNEEFDDFCATARSTIEGPSLNGEGPEKSNSSSVEYPPAEPDAMSL